LMLQGEEPLAQRQYNYTDFIKDDLQYQQSEQYISDEKYWASEFEEPASSFLAPLRKKENKSERHKLVLSRKQYNDIEMLAKSLKVSTFHLILGILYSYLYKYYSVDDISVGLPVLNRYKAIFKKTIGLFMGVSPFRIRLDEEDTFGNILLKIKSQLRTVYRHQRFPIGKLANKLQLFNENDRLFHITLSYEKQNYADNFLNTKCKVTPFSHHAERVALALYIREFDADEEVEIDFDFNTSYFERDRIVQMTDHIRQLIK
ncbi:MAG: condensation domain-containing protein, partial [Cyclobacteriaceae bacterium]